MVCVLSRLNGRLSNSSAVGHVVAAGLAGAFTARAGGAAGLPTHTGFAGVGLSAGATGEADGLAGVTTGGFTAARFTATGAAGFGAAFIVGFEAGAVLDAPRARRTGTCLEALVGGKPNAVKDS